MNDALSPAVLDALRAYRGVLERAFGPRLRELRLFGSFARGEGHEDSDVDVLVRIDDLCDAEIPQVIDLGVGVSQTSGLPLAPLPMASGRYDALLAADRELVREIAAEGISL